MGDLTEAERTLIHDRIFGKDGKHFDREMLQIYANKFRQQANEEDFIKAMDLWAAGWTSKEPSAKCDVMSWFWRRPPIGKRKLGRQYKSTEQAWNAFRRDRSYCGMEIVTPKPRHKCASAGVWSHPRWPYPTVYCEAHKKVLEKFFPTGWVKHKPLSEISIDVKQVFA